jgi:3-oxoacyl-[acyl-carrier protein] reductase
MTGSGRLKGRVALVTGAGRGIGRAIALKLAQEGARLVVNDLDAAPLQALCADLQSLGTPAAACPGSVVEPAFAQAFVDCALANFGAVDIVVNNAGYTWDAVVQKMDDAQWQAMLDVHLGAPFRILRAAQPVFSRQHVADVQAGRVQHRKVVNISSVSGLGGNAGQANYAAAKAGVVGLTKSLAKEWGRYRVNVNCVAFGLIDTRLTEATADAGARIEIGPQSIRVGVNPALKAQMERTIPLGRAGTTDEAAGAVLLFCLPESDYISGQVLVCAGGLDP